MATPPRPEDPPNRMPGPGHAAPTGPLGPPSSADSLPLGQNADGALLANTQTPGTMMGLKPSLPREDLLADKLILAAPRMDVAARFFAQHGFGGSPSGAPEVFDSTTGKRENLMDNSLFGPRAGFHRCFRHCFLTGDRRHLVMPTVRVEGGNSYQPWTYLATADLSRLELDFPGAAIAELPKEGTFVSWGFMIEDKKALPPEVFFVSRSSGRVLRRVSVERFDPHPAMYVVNTRADKTACFVPGHELFLEQDASDHDGSRPVTLVRCGPVAAVPAAAADPNIVVRNVPPARARARQRYEFKPEFDRPANTRLTFKLKKGPAQISVDPESGMVTWTPSPTALGKYDIVLVAATDNAELPVVSWTIEVEPE